MCPKDFFSSLNVVSQPGDSIMLEAILYERLPDNQVRCQLCPRRCRLKEGKQGYCRVRQNQGGKLYSLTYGQVASLSVNPIEKKPVFHFYPGSLWLPWAAWVATSAAPDARIGKSLTPSSDRGGLPIFRQRKVSA